MAEGELMAGTAPSLETRSPKGPWPGTLGCSRGWETVKPTAGTGLRREGQVKGPRKGHVVLCC